VSLRSAQFFWLLWLQNIKQLYVKLERNKWKLYVGNAVSYLLAVMAIGPLLGLLELYTSLSSGYAMIQSSVCENRMYDM